ncbi:MAG: hypothetical protein KGL37_01075 [Acidobacteriota bacterium]|nr:hypothetical protein [Acidobacteriota bacterium]
MRNLFDQYKLPENRLTHALMTSLNEDRALLGKFIKWATGKQAPAPPSQLQVLEQSLPGKEEPQDEEEHVGKGLPDGCIHDGKGWALLIESKITAPLNLRQLRGHRRSAKAHNLTNPDLLALVLKKPEHSETEDENLKQWTELYVWLKREKRQSEWVGRLIHYMEVLEARMLKNGDLKEGTLTVFTGIPFRKEHLYNYDEAKRIIRLAMEGLRSHKELCSEVGVDLERPPKAAIKGKEGNLVWDCFWPKEMDNWTAAPHLSVGIHRDYLNAVLIIPDKVATRFRKRLRDVGLERFQAIVEEVLANFNSKLGKVAGAAPWCAVHQRHYRHQGAVPDVDAELQFDLRTAFKGDESAKIKPQTEWLRAAYDAFRCKSSNIQLEIGGRFLYEHCRDTNSPLILTHIADAWLACKPLIRTMGHD